jgi:hypothetical protein
VNQMVSPSLPARDSLKRVQDKGFYSCRGRTKNILERTFLSLLEVCGFAECSGKSNLTLEAIGWDDGS